MSPAFEGSSPPAGTLFCGGCGARVTLDAPAPFRCPRAIAGDDIDHVLEFPPAMTSVPTDGDEQPFVRYRALLQSHQFALARGMSDEGFVELVRELDNAVAGVAGVGLRITPYVKSAPLATELGLERGEVWVKDETGNPAGSHKLRHLFGIALHLVVAERIGLPARPGPLAIASCGNAALAAAVVARALDRPLDVYVPESADARVLAELASLGARVVTCAREPDAPPGDPCLRRLRAAAADGAVPFTVQGSENGLAIEGGKTLGWELASQHAAGSGPRLDRIAIQVGGGALASACTRALLEACVSGLLQPLILVHAVQTASVHPLERAWRKLEEGVARRLGSHAASQAGLTPRARMRAAADELAHARTHRSDFMWPWEETPRSIATGILDDETYDWRAVCQAMFNVGGSPVVAPEATLARAEERARALTGIDVDATGAAGLAGLFVLQSEGKLAPDERIALLFTGVRR